MDELPSSLATKLAKLPTEKDPFKRALKIDETILRHGRDEREEARQKNKLLPCFCDNINVFRSKDRGEFFELQLLPSEHDMPYEVMFKRYAVPGRYWVYSFYYTRDGSGRVVYGSETDNIVKALKMVEADLNKPQVIELFEQAFSAERIVCRYRHDALTLLKMIAPKTKTYRKIDKLCKTTMEARKVRIEAERKPVLVTA